MNCDRAHSLLPMALYGELGDGERHELDLHVAECPRCSREWSELQRLRLLLSPPFAGDEKSAEERDEEARLLNPVARQLERRS